MGEVERDGDAGMCWLRLSASRNLPAMTLSYDILSKNDNEPSRMETEKIKDASRKERR